MKKILFCFILFALIFIAVDKPKKNIIIEENYGDAAKFDQITVKNEKIVLYDNRVSDKTTFYVIEFSGNMYVVNTYFYLNDKESYANVWNLFADKIVDYDYVNRMIKVQSLIGEGNYELIMQKLDTYIENDVVYIMY